MENYKVLNEVHKGAKTGRDSIGHILDKVEDDKFKKVLASQYDEYQNILEQSAELLSRENKFPEDNPISMKMMNWVGIEVNTLTDKSNCQISDLLIQGTNMGIIKGVELLNHNPNINRDVKSLVSDFVHLQEKNVEELKKFL